VQPDPNLVQCDSCGQWVRISSVRLSGTRQLCNDCFRAERKAQSTATAATRLTKAAEHPMAKLGVRPMVEQFPLPPLVSLLCGWTFVWIALWMAAIGAFIGFVMGLLGGSFAGLPLAPANPPSFGIVSAMAGAVIGAVVLFLSLYVIGGISGWLSCLVSVATGAVIALLITSIATASEPWSMQMRGYRRLSDRERAHVGPIIDDVCQAMRLTERPTFLISDHVVPAAWAHSHHVVVTSGALELDGGQLGAMIAHEVAHYRASDATYGRFVWACALPVAILTNVQSFVNKRGGQGFGLIIGIVLWPAVVLLHFAIAPAMSSWSRGCEYRADAIAAQAGYGPGLIKLLDDLKIFEPGRTGWSSVMNATHPPMELRVEAIQRRMEAPQPTTNVTALTPSQTS
jgi:Zn-dependent protease with chaperone function